MNKYVIATIIYIKLSEMSAYDKEPGPPDPYPLHLPFPQGACFKYIASELVDVKGSLKQFPVFGGN